MYSTCLFCYTELGANEAIEQFPVGRAGISDDMFLPEDISRQLDEMKGH